ncbi:hypothetical protein CF139_19855 [Aeromonas hydrophila]|nr:hypothetical protein CF139_19855 [Aeromonas hydrophila]
MDLLYRHSQESLCHAVGSTAHPRAVSGSAPGSHRWRHHLLHSLRPPSATGCGPGAPDRFPAPAYLHPLQEDALSRGALTHQPRIRKMTSLTASCLCGAVALSLPDRFDYLGNCHCSECRKFSGADYAPVGGLDGALVTITRGEEAISRFQKSPETTLAFCRQCGSSLFSEKRSSGKLNLRLGILDTAPSQRPGCHIFVGSKAPWHEITDELPQFEARPTA